ncbi:MAG TPA: tetratricopeptide repeat protein [Candidatus Dormibacteraeota bacterium]|nr:tetratricopeptide repeat protein [Candidatus Dormibacteraeota bacterium]
MNSSPLRTADVARVLAIPPARVRAMVRAGWCRPGREGGQFRFAFQDVVLLRTALGLRQARVPASRVRRALRELLRQLPSDRPLSGVRIVAAGGRVVARSGDRVWQPESGQLQFAFTVDELARRAEAPRALSPKPRPAAPPPPAPGETASDWFERGVALEDDDLEAARSAYERAVTIDPEHADAWVNLGRLAHEAGDPATAARCYHQALMRDETDPVTHFNLALANEDLEKSGEATAHYRRAVALNPRFADAHYNLAQLLSRLGRRDEAVRHMVRYRQLMRRK